MPLSKPRTRVWPNALAALTVIGLLTCALVACSDGNTGGPTTTAKETVAATATATPARPAPVDNAHAEARTSRPTTEASASFN